MNNTNNLKDVYLEYRDVINQMIKTDNHSDYWFCHNYEYNLPVDILLDTTQEYSLHGLKQPCIYFRNSYSHTGEFVKLDISNDPDISDIIQILKIYREDFFKIYLFVTNNCELLLKLAEEEIDIVEFNQSIKKLHESMTPLNEMGKFSPNITGLAAKIWIDNGNTASKSGHSNSDRIKFQNPKQEKDSRRWSSLIIKGLVVESDAEIEWTTKEMNDLYKFIEVNAEMIHTAMREQWPDSKILNHIIRIGKNGELIKPLSEVPYYELNDIGYNMKIVRNSDGKFNIQLPNGKLITDNWYDHISDFSKNNNKFAYAYSNGETTIIYPNGNFQKKENK